MLGNKIKTLSNKILKENSQNIFFLSNDWLFFKRQHPVEYEKYKFIDKKFYLIFIKFLLLFCKYQTKNILFLVISLKNYFQFNRKKVEKIDTIFVTYKFNNLYTFANDAYFKDTYNIFKKRNKKFFVIAVNHQRNYFKKKNKIKNFYELNKLSHFHYEVYYYLVLNYLLIKNFLKIFQLSSSFEKKFYLELSINFLSGNTIDNLRYFHQLKNIIKKKNIKSIVSIFEGHALERLIFRAAKIIDSKITTIAYNHSLISKKHNAVFLDLGKINQPDKIIFSNQISKKIFKKKIYNKKQVLHCVSKNINKVKQFKNRNKNYCLVAPEGLDSETIKLFNFTINYLKKYNDKVFIWRFHPIYYNQEQNFIKQNIFDFKEFKKKIIISKSSLSNDLNKSKYILFRGSSVVIPAIFKDLVPLYLNLNSNFENNFLQDCDGRCSIQINNINDLYHIKKKNREIYQIFKNKKKILNLYAVNNNHNQLKYYS